MIVICNLVDIKKRKAFEMINDVGRISSDASQQNKIKLLTANYCL